MTVRVEGLNFTEPRWRALRAAYAHSDDRTYPIRESNGTDPLTGHIYWSTLAWLVEHGLVATPAPGRWAITARGREIHARILAAGAQQELPL